MPICPLPVPKVPFCYVHNTEPCRLCTTQRQGTPFRDSDVTQPRSRNTVSPAAYPLPGDLGSQLGICNQLESPPDQLEVSSAQGQTPVSKKSSPGDGKGEGKQGSSPQRQGAVGCIQSSQDRQPVNLYLIPVRLSSCFSGQYLLPSLFSRHLFLTSFSRYWLKISVSFKRVTLHFPLQERGQKTLGEFLISSVQQLQYTSPSFPPSK